MKEGKEKEKKKTFFSIISINCVIYHIATRIVQFPAHYVISRVAVL